MTDLSRYAQIAEIVSAVAVVLSLLYVGYELRQNTQMMSANAKIESRRIWYSFNDQHLENFDTLSLGAQAYDPNTSLADFEGNEEIWLGLFVRAQLQRYEELFYRYDSGVLEKDEWERHTSVLAAYIQDLPIWKEVWSQDRLLLTPAFVSATESITPSGFVNTAGSSQNHNEPTPSQ